MWKEAESLGLHIEQEGELKFLNYKVNYCLTIVTHQFKTNRRSKGQMNSSDLIQCPYDRAHMISENRMQSHLYKCERNHKNIIKLLCPFNATHRIDNAEFMTHITSCPNRRVIEWHKYVVKGEQGCKSIPYTEPKLPEPEENWDEEPPCETYDPSKYTERSSVLRKPIGISKAERKVFYEMEVQRLNRIQSIGIDHSDTDEDEVYSEDLTRKEKDKSTMVSINPCLGLGRGTNFRKKKTMEMRPGLDSSNKSESSGFSYSRDTNKDKIGFKVTMNFSFGRNAEMGKTK
ncbi:hypothetical protein L9F63_005637 [Diploptera punctata]|uniref:CHHC U11-48K-type domain-containing protein n=1 Tax=Diploptera punctata TaxID=6984 RepID=A0AAD8E5P5_DIPPU|nr:hypothetical protein L9F63_005637 [Diploptera punctata]